MAVGRRRHVVGMCTLGALTVPRSRQTLPPYTPDDMTQFVTHYSGKVVANLRAADGSRIGCRLHLVQPARGMAGGGEGQCQILGDGTIQARF